MTKPPVQKAPHKPAVVSRIPRFDLNAELVARALPLVADGLQKYQRIQRELHRCDVSTNTDFQRWFGGFYRVRRNARWRQQFFTMLEAGKARPTEFVEVLRELQKRTGRIEASFASKLVATLDPSQPVIDSIVLHNLGLALPPVSTSKERRIERIASLHQQLRDTFSDLLASPDGRALVDQFSAMYPNAGITKPKMLDLVLWQSRDAHDPWIASQRSKAIVRVLEKAKTLDAEYRELTGKPLGVTGEVAEYEAARLLNLDLTVARQAGYDAVGRDGIRYQIKGRRLGAGSKRSQQVGRIDVSQEFDRVLVVVMDENLEATAIYEATRLAVESALIAPGSKARNERGALALSKFKAIGHRVWPSKEIK